LARGGGWGGEGGGKRRLIGNNGRNGCEGEGSGLGDGLGGQRRAKGEGFFGR